MQENMAMQGGATLRRPVQTNNIPSTENLMTQLNQLQKAIQYGDVEKSKELVALLAKQKAELDLHEKPETFSGSFNNEMRFVIFKLVFILQ